MRTGALLLACSLLTSSGCAGDDDLNDSLGGKGDTGDFVISDATPPDSTVDSANADSSIEPDSTLDTDTADTADTADTTAPDVGCSSVATCPGIDSECAKRTCVDGKCAFALAAAGTSVAMQTPFDCKRNECDGKGSATITYDPTDLPIDGNDCTDDRCITPAPSNPARPAGTPCSKGTCDGAGTCIECVTATTCPGSDLECSKRACTGGSCSIVNVAAGTKSSIQTAGDCRVTQCDGAGALRVVNDDTDAPPDGNPCTKDICTSGTVSHPVEPLGTACGGGKVCNGSGACVGCNVDTDCPAPTLQCRVRKCTSNTCGFVNAPLNSTCAQFDGGVGYCSSFGSCNPFPSSPG